MSDDDNRHDHDDLRYGIHWPPSPRMQIILIAIGFGLLNAVLLAIWAFALYLSR